MDDEPHEIVAIDLAKIPNMNATLGFSSISAGSNRLPACTEDMFGNFLTGGVGSFFYLQCVIGVLILIANVTVLVILIPKHPKCNQDFYLLNLLLAETLIYFVYYPLYLYNEFRGCWDLPYWLCLWKTFCARVFMSASAFAVCLIAYDRYLILQLGVRYDEYENTYKVWLRIVVFWVVVSLLFGTLTAIDILMGGIALDAASQIGYCPAFYSAGPFPEVPTKLLMHCGPVVLCLFIYLLVLCRLLQRKTLHTAATLSPQQSTASAALALKLSSGSNNAKKCHIESNGSLKILSSEKSTQHYRNHYSSEPAVDASQINARISPGLLPSDNSKQQLLQLSAVNSVDDDLSTAAAAKSGGRSSPHPQRLFLTTTNIPNAESVDNNATLSPISRTFEDINLLSVEAEHESELLSNESSQSSRRSSTFATQQPSTTNAKTSARPLFWRLLGRKQQQNRPEEQQHMRARGESLRSRTVETQKTLTVPHLPSRRSSSTTYQRHKFVEPDSISEIVSSHNQTSISSTQPSSTSTSTTLCIASPLNRHNSTRSLRETTSSSFRQALLAHDGAAAAATCAGPRASRITRANRYLFPQYSTGSVSIVQRNPAALLLPSISVDSGAKPAPVRKKTQKPPSSIHQTRRRAMLKRASKTVLCITVAFFVCWIPEAVLSVLMMSCFDSANQPLSTCNLDAIWLGKQVSLILVLLNAFINPIIYTLTMPDVKRRTTRALRRSIVFRYCCGNNRKNPGGKSLSVSQDEASGNQRSIPAAPAPRTAHSSHNAHHNGEILTSDC